MSIYVKKKSPCHLEAKMLTFAGIKWSKLHWQEKESNMFVQATHLPSHQLDAPRKIINQPKHPVMEIILRQKILTSPLQHKPND